MEEKELLLKKTIDEVPKIDWLKEIEIYYQSNRMIRKHKPFDLLIEKYNCLYNQYSDSFEQFYNEINDISTIKEYAKGGECFHRGYYFPGAMNLIVSNYNKGRLIKKISKSKNYDYEYLFDPLGFMICSHKYTTPNFNSSYELYNTEFFVYQDNIVFSFIFKYDSCYPPKLDFISISRYENKKIHTYEFAYFIADKCVEVEVEIHEYMGDLLQSFYRCTYFHPGHKFYPNKFTYNEEENSYFRLP